MPAGRDTDDCSCKSSHLSPCLYFENLLPLHLLLPIFQSSHLLPKRALPWWISSPQPPKYVHEERQRNLLFLTCCCCHLPRQLQPLCGRDANCMSSPHSYKRTGCLAWHSLLLLLLWCGDFPPPFVEWWAFFVKKTENIFNIQICLRKGLKGRRERTFSQKEEGGKHHHQKGGGITHLSLPGKQHRSKRERREKTTTPTEEVKQHQCKEGEGKEHHVRREEVKSTQPRKKMMETTMSPERRRSESSTTHKEAERSCSTASLFWAVLLFLSPVVVLCSLLLLRIGVAFSLRKCCLCHLPCERGPCLIQNTCHYFNEL